MGFSGVGTASDHPSPADGLEQSRSVVKASSKDPVNEFTDPIWGIAGTSPTERELERFFQSCRTRLVRIAGGRLSHDRAEDAVGLVAFRAFRSRQTFRFPATGEMSRPLFAWLTHILRNACRDIQIEQYSTDNHERQVASFEQNGEESDGTEGFTQELLRAHLSASESPEDQALAQVSREESARWLQSLLENAGLGYWQRICLEGFLKGEMSTETGERLGIPDNRVRAHQYSARTRLRKFAESERNGKRKRKNRRATSPVASLP